MTAPLRVMVASAASPGHAFPALALAAALRARGHEVMVETSTRWRGAAEGLGLRLSPLEALGEPPGDGSWTDHVVRGTASRLPLIREYRPDVVVSDVVAPAAPLAAEVLGVRWATLMPVVYTLDRPGRPPYPLGFVPPRTPLGSAMWWLARPPLRALVSHTRWMLRVPRLVNDARRQLGLPAQTAFPGGLSSYGAISDGLVLVATFPQLEYPRRWPSHVHVTGPLLFELAHPDVELPPGDDPLVVVAESTGQDEGRGMLGTALAALADEPVRVVATLNDEGATWSGPEPENAVVVDWVSYAQVLPQASLIVCRGGHGTVVRALADGVPLLVCPAAGDMPENGARVTWAGAGLMVPRRLVAPAALRSAARRLLADRGYADRARAIAAWGRQHDGAMTGAELVERYARR